MKIVTPKIRFIVITAYQTGTASRQQLAAIFDYYLEIIDKYIRSSQQKQSVPLPRGHRHSVFNAEEMEQLAAYIESNPDATLGSVYTSFMLLEDITQGRCSHEKSTTAT